MCSFCCCIPVCTHLIEIITFFALKLFPLTCEIFHIRILTYMWCLRLMISDCGKWINRITKKNFTWSLLKCIAMMMMDLQMQVLYVVQCHASIACNYVFFCVCLIQWKKGFWVLQWGNALTWMHKDQKCMHVPFLIQKGLELSF